MPQGVVPCGLETAVVRYLRKFSRPFASRVFAIQTRAARRSLERLFLDPMRSRRWFSRLLRPAARRRDTADGESEATTDRPVQPAALDVPDQSRTCSAGGGAEP